MIHKIRLQNIRSFSNAEFEFSDGVNLIIGPNGSGKTTILESIGLFAFGSYLGAGQDVQAVAFGNEVGRVEIEGEKEGSEVSAECVIFEGGKIFKVLTNKIPASQMIGYFKAVLFNPETINLVSGAPQVRRKELDVVIAQKKRVFVRTLLEYKNVLKQRNQLIKRIVLKQAQEGELEFWNGELIRLAGIIIFERKKFLKTINSDIARVHEQLIGGKSTLSLQYLPSCDYGRFGELLVANLEHDLRAGLTLYGPHRDDFSFQMRSENKNQESRIKNQGGDERTQISLREQASRGEQRLAAVAFKMETKKYLADGDGPILIFDDIFSELDEARRESVASILDGDSLDRARDRQIFISATDEHIVPVGLKKKAKIIRLE